MTNRSATIQWASDWSIPFLFNAWVQASLFLAILSLIAGYALELEVHRPEATAVWVAALALTKIVTACLAFLIFPATAFGWGTVKAFRITREHIEKHHKLDIKFQEVYARKMYCARAGVRAAAIRYGHPNELIPRLANRWMPL